MSREPSNVEAVISWSIGSMSVFNQFRDGRWTLTTVSADGKPVDKHHLAVASEEDNRKQVEYMVHEWQDGLSCEDMTIATGIPRPHWRLRKYRSTQEGAGGALCYEIAEQKCVHDPVRNAYTYDKFEEDVAIGKDELVARVLELVNTFKVPIQPVDISF